MEPLSGVDSVVTLSLESSHQSINGDKLFTWILRPQETELYNRLPPCTSKYTGYPATTSRECIQDKYDSICRSSLLPLVVLIITIFPYQIGEFKMSSEQNIIWD